MRVTFKVYRYQPEIRDGAYYDTFAFDAEPTDRVLDGLQAHEVQEIRGRRVEIERWPRARTPDGLELTSPLIGLSALAVDRVALD